MRSVCVCGEAAVRVNADGVCTDAMLRDVGAEGCGGHPAATARLCYCGPTQGVWPAGMARLALGTGGGGGGAAVAAPPASASARLRPPNVQFPMSAYSSDGRLVCYTEKAPNGRLV